MLHGIDSIPYSAIAGLPTTRAPGHRGSLLVAQSSGIRLLVLQGRVHLYEGWNVTEATAYVRLLHALGIKRLILTNAAGSLNPSFPPGDWMTITDHLNLTGTSPLLGGPNFCDLSEVYDRGMRGVFETSARLLDIPLHAGVYAGLVGPQYETPAEIRMLRALGADAVGMSTVLEAIQAHALGMKLCALSCLTNWAAGMSPNPPSHEAIIDIASQASQKLIRLLAASLPNVS